MDDSQIIELVRRMRAAQKSWFKFKMPVDLQQAKELEAQVDRALEARNSKQGTLL